MISRKDPEYTHRGTCAARPSYMQPDTNSSSPISPPCFSGMRFWGLRLGSRVLKLLGFRGLRFRVSGFEVGSLGFKAFGLARSRPRLLRLEAQGHTIHMLQVSWMSTFISNLRAS